MSRARLDPTPDWIPAALRASAPRFRRATRALSASSAPSRIERSRASGPGAMAAGHVRLGPSDSPPASHGHPSGGVCATDTGILLARAATLGRPRLA